MRIIKTSLLCALLISLTAAAALADDVCGDAITLYSQGRFEDAIAQAKEYADDYPDPEAYYLIGYALYNMGMFEEADDYFAQAYLIDPEFSPDELLKKIDELAPAKKKKPRAKRKRPTAAHIASAAPAIANAPVPPEAKPAAIAPIGNAAVAIAAKPIVADAAVANAPIVSNAAAAVPVVVKPSAPPSPPPSGFSLRDLPFAGAMRGALGGVLAGLGILLIVIPAAIYLFWSLCLFLIARKLDTKAAWTAFVPVAQLWAMVGSSGKPWWWMLLLFVPILGIAVFIYLWVLIAERLGRARFLGILMILPGINFVILVILALSKAKKKPDLASMMPDFGEPREPEPHIEDFPDFGETRKMEREDSPPGDF